MLKVEKEILMWPFAAIAQLSQAPWHPLAGLLLCSRHCETTGNTKVKESGSLQGLLVWQVKVCTEDAKNKKMTKP